MHYFVYYYTVSRYVYFSSIDTKHSELGGEGLRDYMPVDSQIMIKYNIKNL